VIRDAFKDLNRVRQIAVIAAKYGFAEYVDRGGLWRVLGRREEVAEAPEVGRASTARRFRIMLAELGPTFVKLGQVMSTRADLLPAEFVEELAHLQDQVPPFPMDQVQAQLRAGLGRDPAELFREIDPTPLAAASIAQVHRAVTRDGAEVVIKVQRPGIGESIRADLSVLRALARMLEALVDDTGVYTPTGIVDEFDRAIHEELDFLHEAANLRAFQRTHEGRSRVQIPALHESLSCKTVLTMQLLRGVKVGQPEFAGHSPEGLARLLVEESFRQLFDDGLFHGDPHPGNILVLPQENGEERVALLDFGLVGRVSPQMQETLVMLVLAIALKDADSAARILYRVGAPDTRTNLTGFRNDIQGILGAYLPATLGEVDARVMFRDLLDLAVRYHIRVPREYAILSRATVAMEGMLRSLHPNMNIGEIALPYAQELLKDRYDPSQLQGNLARTLFRVQGLASDVPLQLSQILLDLESGKFTIAVRSPAMEQLPGQLRTLAVVVFLGLCVCGLIVGTFISFPQGTGTPLQGVPLHGVLAASAAAAISGGVLSWALLAGRWRKVPLQKLIGKRREPPR